MIGTTNSNNYKGLVVVDENDPSVALNKIGAQAKITGTPGQFVVIGDDGNVTTKTVPNAEEVAF